MGISQKFPDSGFWWFLKGDFLRKSCPLEIFAQLLVNFTLIKLLPNEQSMVRLQLTDQKCTRNTIFIDCFLKLVAENCLVNPSIDCVLKLIFDLSFLDYINSFPRTSSDPCPVSLTFDSRCAKINFNSKLLNCSCSIGSVSFTNYYCTSTKAVYYIDNCIKFFSRFECSSLLIFLRKIFMHNLSERTRRFCAVQQLFAG